MEKISIDEIKLPKVMKIIEQAASIMAEKDYAADKDVKRELENLQKDLRNITQNSEIDITDFKEYWGYTDLEIVARKALMPPPEKRNVTNNEIREIVLGILDFEEAEMDYWLEFLEVNTGLDNLTDYIFYPDLVGLDGDASLAEIADKIIKDFQEE